MSERGEALPGFDPDGLVSIGLCDDPTLLTVRDGRWWVGELPADPVAVADLIEAWRGGVRGRRIEGRDGEAGGEATTGVALTFLDRRRGGLRLRVGPPDAAGLSTVVDSQGAWVIQTPRPDLLRCGAWQWLDRDGLRERAGTIRGLALEMAGGSVEVTKASAGWSAAGTPLDGTAVERLLQRWMLARARPPHEGPTAPAVAAGVIHFSQGARVPVEIGADWVRFGAEAPRAMEDAETLLPEISSLAAR